MDPISIAVMEGKHSEVYWAGLARHLYNKEKQRADVERDRVNYWRSKAKRQRVAAIRAAAGAAVGWTLAVLLAVMLVGRW